MGTAALKFPILCPIFLLAKDDWDEVTSYGSAEGEMQDDEEWPEGM